MQWWQEFPRKLLVGCRGEKANRPYNGDVLDFDAEGLAVDSQGVRYQQVSAQTVQRLE